MSQTDLVKSLSCLFHLMIDWLQCNCRTELRGAGQLPRHQHIRGTNITGIIVIMVPAALAHTVNNVRQPCPRPKSLKNVGSKWRQIITLPAASARLGPAFGAILHSLASVLSVGVR
jgi:hypothetical protein